MKHALRSILLSVLVLPLAQATTTFTLETASIEDIQAAVDAGALTYEKLVTLYLARIKAYNEAGPALHTIITLNPKALDEARALDAERKAKGRRSPLHGIPILPKDNYDTVDLPTTAGSFLLDGSIPPQDSTMIKKLRDAGVIILGKTNLNEFASGGPGTPSGFSSLGGQTRNPHDPTRGPGGSSGGTGSALAAWFAPLGLGTDTGGSIRNPCSFNGIPGIKPTNGLLSRAGIVPLSLSFDTGGPMARNVYDVAVALGIMTGIDSRDPLTTTQSGLAYSDYTPFLKKDSLKGARIGINRNYVGQDAEVDEILDRAVGELKAAGATVIDPANYPDYVINAKAGIMNAIRYTEFREQIHDYLATLKPGYPKNLTEMIAKADALKEPNGRYAPNPGRFAAFKLENAGPAPTTMSYRAAKEYGMPMIRAAVLGVFEEKKLDAIVYTTNPAPAPVIVPPFNAPPGTPSGSGNSLTNVANITNFPDVIVPAGVTKNKLPVTLSFFGPAYSEPKLLAYAYAYEQATHHEVSPSTTPALPGETFTY
jgi:amidase